MSELTPIRTPLTQHLRRIRYQLVPVLVFGGVVVLAGWLWGRHRNMPDTVGQVEAVRVAVRSSSAGLLCSLDSGPLKLFDRVAAGQAVARLDDAPAQAALDALKQEAERLQAELSAAADRLRAEQAERGYDRHSESRRLALDVERARLTILGLQTDLQGQTIRRRRFKKLLEETEKAYRAGGASLQAVVDLTLRRDEAEVRIQANNRAMKQAQADLKAAEQRLGAHPQPRSTDLETYLCPFRQARTVQEARVRELSLQISSMTIRAPIEGIIAAIYRRPGQAVAPGEDILIIAADRGRHVVTYVRQHQRVSPEVGMDVTLRSRSGDRQLVKAKVVRVGPQVEQVPPHQLADPTRPEWGLPVMISIPAGIYLRPGELVDVAFQAG